MESVLPQQSGLTVNGVLYQYTVRKEVEDNFSVTIENDNLLGAGTIFEQTDDWSGLAGNTLTGFQPLSNIPLEYWGEGRIRSEGDGSVSGANVRYSYQFDPCYVVLSNPECPGYAAALLDLLNSLPKDQWEEDPLLAEYLEGLAVDVEQREQELEEEKEEKSEEDMETALRASDAAEKIADVAVQESMMKALSAQQKLNAYYTENIPGGSYSDTVQIRDAKIDDNRAAALRMGFANDKKHNELVDLQY